MNTVLIEGTTYRFYIKDKLYLTVNASEALSKKDIETYRKDPKSLRAQLEASVESEEPTIESLLIDACMDYKDGGNIDNLKKTLKEIEALVEKA